jgi:two-component system response regulator AlgR
VNDVKVLVVDDEELARERLEKLIAGLPGYAVVETCGDAQSAINLLQGQDFDVVLLDISMPGMSGLDLARFIKGLDVPPAVIFCTAHDEHAITAFEAGGSAYLLKPVREGKLLESLEGARRMNRMQRQSIKLDDLGRSSESFCIESHRGVEMVPVSSVSHIVADQKYVTLYHPGGEALMETSLRAIEDDYPQVFVRIHRNALANLGYMAGIKRNTSGEAFLKLTGSKQEPRISRRHLKDVKKLLAST